MEELTESEEFIFKWQYRALGQFKTALIEAIMLADDDNIAKLYLGFPNEIDGYISYTQIPGWWKEVLRKVGKVK